MREQAQTTTPAAAGVVAGRCADRTLSAEKRLLAAPGLDCFLELVVAVDVAGPLAAVDLVEGRELCVQPASQFGIARIRGLVGFVDQDEVILGS